MKPPITDYQDPRSDRALLVVAMLFAVAVVFLAMTLLTGCVTSVYTETLPDGRKIVDKQTGLLFTMDGFGYTRSNGQRNITFQRVTGDAQMAKTIGGVVLDGVKMGLLAGGHTNVNLVVTNAP